jgi:hypothetical protein
MDKEIPVLEEQVSLIMTLGRMVYLFHSYGPSPKEDRFAEHMLWHIPNMESDFRKTNDFEKLKADLWYIRCIAERYSHYIRENFKSRDPNYRYPCLIGCSEAEGTDMEGEYTFLTYPYAEELSQFFKLMLKDGKFKDPHEGFPPIEPDISRLILGEPPE